MNPDLLRFKEVTELLGVSRSTIYSWLKENNFPKPQRLGPKILFWQRADVEAWATQTPPSTDTDYPTRSDNRKEVKS